MFFAAKIQKLSYSIWNDVKNVIFASKFDLNKILHLPRVRSDLQSERIEYQHL